ncbi:hypothetical protein E2562_006123 [Oryza meyeriana var. granulata]|uniref:Uncharacterized protein n=1 Tax=Oryza meyeriana var. granulata TaxID=110450 RepID=A0A6G1EVN3_9ORYZ|nr:hypothetical protein E2562_006123 [Oryza meyeriana var. granulata]
MTSAHHANALRNAARTADSGRWSTVAVGDTAYVSNMFGRTHRGLPGKNANRTPTEPPFSSGRCCVVVVGGGGASGCRH